MCTAATYKTKDFYFGRTFDYEFSYGEEVVITPRKYPFEFRTKGKMESHLAMIGTAYVMQDYPLYYEAVNEKGLGMAGLNFEGKHRPFRVHPLDTRSMRKRWRCPFAFREDQFSRHFVQRAASTLSSALDDSG